MKVAIVTGLVTAMESLGEESIVAVYPCSGLGIRKPYCVIYCTGKVAKDFIVGSLPTVKCHDWGDGIFRIEVALSNPDAVKEKIHRAMAVA